MKLRDLHVEHHYLKRKELKERNEKMRNEIQATLNDMNKWLVYRGTPKIEGWVEALEYVLGRMDAQGEEE